LLAAFDSLEPADKQQVAIEILRRSGGLDEISDQAFDEAALELLQGYDAEESRLCDR
jgi:hypothetical protein